MSAVSAPARLLTSVRRLDAREPAFDAALSELLAFDATQNEAIERAVAGIVEDVRLRGDPALLEYTRRFDRVDKASVAELEVPAPALRGAFEALDAADRAALQTAADRIRTYHQRQRSESWSFTEADGTRLGQQVTPLDRVGVYVPGGKASYPSSVLMNAMPAQVAGVREIVMAVPAPDGVVNPMVFAAAHLAGVNRVFTIGGAQAVAALAYGTATIPAVDKVVGPGNAYVAAAKRRVFGTVGIDMVAGPSEIMVIADASANPDWVAMDLFSQAEHDELAQALLLSPDANLLDAVAASIERLLPQMPRRAIISASLAARGALIRVRDLGHACEIANRVAPEHLELALAAPEASLALIRNAGAIFVGHYSSEALGDYCAGPNHVLPTSGSARFSSPLGVYDFQKRSSVLVISQAGARELGAIAGRIADGEGLHAHACSARYRIESPK